MFENIKDAIAVIKNKFKSTPEKEPERYRIVPCAYKDCIYYLTYHISKEKANYFGQMPQALISCIFCVRFSSQRDMFIHKKETNES